MPLTSDSSTNGVTNRRSASPRQGTSATPGPLPVLTRIAYQRIVQGREDATADVGQMRLRRLAAARAKIGEAKLLVDAAMKAHNPQVGSTPDAQAQQAPIYNRLRGIAELMDRAWLTFPLEVGK